MYSLYSIGPDGFCFHRKSEHVLVITFRLRVKGMGRVEDDGSAFDAGQIEPLATVLVWHSLSDMSDV
jgi:hypothetical protein